MSSCRSVRISHRLGRHENAVRDPNDSIRRNAQCRHVVCNLVVDALARLEVPGGNIRNIALNAAFLAAGSREPIADAHVLHAARREYAKIDKLLTPAEFGADYYKGNA